MSYIDYSARPKAAYNDEQPAASENPFADQPSSSAAAQDGYENGHAAAYQPANPPAVTQHYGSGRGHDFTVEHQKTDGDQVGNYDPYGTRAAEAAGHQEPFFDPTFEDYTHEAPLEMPFFDHVVQDYGEFGFFNRMRLRVRQGISFLLTLGALGLVVVASFVWYLNPLAKKPPRARADREYERRVTGERGSGRVQYYAEVRDCAKVFDA